MECDIFPSVLWQWVSICWWWRFDWSFTHLITPVVTTTYITLSSNKIQNGDILVPANPGTRGKWALKWRVVWHCLLGDKKGIQHIERWVLVCWWWQFDWSFACLTTPAITTSIVCSSNKIQNEDILAPAYLGCAGKWLLNECDCRCSSVM